MTMLNLALDRITQAERMPVFYLVFAAVLFLYITPCFGQSKLYLQHRYKPNRQKNISLKKEYIFQTKDTTLYRYQITSFSDTSLKIRSRSKADSIQIPVIDIKRIEKAKKYGVFEVVATLGLIGLSITPVIWATEGSEEALGMLEASGFLLAVSVPILVIKEVGRKSDAKSKWIILVKE